MAKIGSTSFTALSVVSAIALTAAFVACSNDADTLGKSGSSGASSSGSVDGDGGTGEGGSSSGPSAQETLFRGLEADFKTKCGGACHEMGTYTGSPPAFLGPPDAYKSIKAQPGVVVSDYYSSTILNKGAHAGPAIGDDPTFEAKVVAWLQLEAAVIQAVAKPSTDPVALVNGANDVDMTKACVGGLTGVHLLFDASLVAGILSLNNIRVHAAAGTDVHVYQPQFVRVLAKADANGQTEYYDGTDTFSNTDQTVPGGADTVLTPGSALFTAANWSPFDFSSDKIRIEVAKLEPGKVSVIQKAPTCANVASFTANVLPILKGGGAAPFNLNCNGCHSAGLAGLALSGADQTVVCNQVLGKLNTTDITKSLIITHLSPGGGHGGGNINDVTAWTKVWTDNKADFF